MPALGVGSGETKWERVKTGQVLFSAVAAKRTGAPGHNSPHSSLHTTGAIPGDVPVSGLMAHYCAFYKHHSFSAHLSGA